jgi:hypothetical protein
MLPAKAATEARRIRNSTFIDRQGYQSRTGVGPSRKCIVRLGLNQGLRVFNFRPPKAIIGPR